MGGVTGGMVPSLIDDPHADRFTRPFWVAALEGRLTAQECIECGMRLLPPAPRCPRCRSDAFRTVDLPGTGSIYSFTVVRHALRPDLIDQLPYVSAVVELDETQGAGARMIVNLVGCDPAEVAIGDRVRIIFDPVSDSYATPRAEKRA